MRIRPARHIRGLVKVPGDKSISHRAAIIAALAQGPSTISNFSTADDCATTLSCLEQVGAQISRTETEVLIVGTGLQGLTPPAQPLNCGNSGSTMRMLAGVLAGQSFVSQLTGDESLCSRPMERVIKPLELMGAQIQSDKGKPPLQISGAVPLRAIAFESPVASAQVKSCVLLAGLFASGQTTVIEPVATRDHTERMLSLFAVPISTTAANGGSRVTISGQNEFCAHDISIPGDISSAAFLIAAAMLLPGSHLTIKGVGLNPSRTQFLSEFISYGARIRFSELAQVSNEPVGTVQVTGGLDVSAPHPTAKQLTNTMIPQVIDELPLLAVVGSQLEGGIEIRDAAELRVKESDRIALTARNLRAMGVQVEEFPDGLAVPGPVKLRGGVLETGGDHRIAMAFTIAGLIAESECEIVDAECVTISFPDFFQLLEAVVER